MMSGPPESPEHEPEPETLCAVRFVDDTSTTVSTAKWSSPITPVFVTPNPAICAVVLRYSLTFPANSPSGRIGTG
jgi:hypothetical protein